MKTIAQFISCLILWGLSATAQGLVISSMQRIVTTGDFDPVLHYASTSSAGAFTTNMGSSTTSFGAGWGPSATTSVNWDLAQDSNIAATPNSLNITGTVELSTGGTVSANFPGASVNWDDTNRLEVLFTTDQPCEFAFSADSNSSQAVESSEYGINCYTRVSGGPAGGTNATYQFGCRAPYGWTNQVQSTGSVTGILPSGIYRFSVILVEFEGASAVQDPTGQFPPQGGLGCHAKMSFNFSLKYPAFFPNIVSHQIVDGSAVLEVLTRPNSQCYVEYSDSLAATQWQALPSINGTGATAFVTNSLPSIGSRFYRVKTAN